MAKPGKLSTILKYGQDFPAHSDPSAIELFAISKLGKWEFRGRKCGEGLAFHMKAFMKLAWPMMEFHRWVDLEIDEFCRAGRLGVFGPSSSGKSFVFTRCGLTLFYARPGTPDGEQDGTTCIISSTTIPALERRIWDYVVTSHRSAKKTLPWLPGHMIESRRMLLADPSDVDGRSMKNGIIGVACNRGGKWQGLEEYVGIKNKVFILIADECFPAGTMVDTPSGPTPIEQIKPGMEVLNACGIGRVSVCMKRMSQDIVTIRFKNGTKLRCTSNHPFLTQSGWKKACELNQSHYILSRNEALRIVQSNCEVETQGSAFLRKLLLSEMVVDATRGGTEAKKEKGASILPVLRNESSVRNMEQVLQSPMLSPAHALTTWIPGKKREEIKCIVEAGPHQQPGMGKENIRTDEASEPDDDRCCRTQGEQNLEANRPPTEGPRRQWNWTDRIRKNINGILSLCSEQFSGQDWNEKRKWIPNFIQGGLGISGNSLGRRGRRTLSWVEGSEETRPEENESPTGAWVDRVEISKSGDYSGNVFSRESDFVYNLQVDTHPSYSVNGLLVHNCYAMPSGFLDALANLESNGTVFTAMLGNLPDLDNPLAHACEPKLGWNSLPATKVSRAYDTKWMGGRAIQLIGYDSPNFDFPEGEEPYKNLIGRAYIRRCEYNYGKGTLKFCMFAEGGIPDTTMSASVFSKADAVKNNALDQVQWSHHPLVRGYAMDVSYSGVGGDRSVGAPFLFGKDVIGRWRVLLGSVKIYTGSHEPGKSHCRAMAEEVRRECEAYDVPPEHFFYDGTGRSEFTIEIARAWSSKVVPIEFGGVATDRPSFTGERHLHGDKAGEVKTCRESYDRFVTELWFAWAYAITSGQMRGLTEEVIEEGSRRRWEIVRGAKQSVETKDDMKDRGLRSPDLGDMCVAAIEGARRLNFPLGKDSTITMRKTSLWLKQEAEAQWDKFSQMELAS